ncbi:hypothetical protein Tco_0448566 [Tanacetum coccineum]
MALNRSKSRYSIKECSTCGSWYTKECCSIGNLNDQIIIPEPDSSVHCAVCGTPVDGPYCHGCTRIRMKFEKDLFAYCVDNGVFQNFQDTSESSNDNTNVVNAPREPSVVDQDPGVNISQDPPQIDHNCCYECGDSLNGIFLSKMHLWILWKSCGGPHETYQCQPMNQEYFYSHSSGFDQFQPPQFSDVYQTPPVASMEMLHAQADLIESMQNFLMKYDHIPHNEKSIKLLLAEEKFLKIKQVVEEEQTQPEYLQELLQNLLKDLQILNEIQLLKQETPNLIQKDQEEKNIAELLAEERFQKANQALNESQSPQELRIQDLEIQKQQCLEEIIRDGRKKIEDMSIEEMMHEQQLVDREIKGIINDLGYIKDSRQRRFDENMKIEKAYEDEKYSAACRYMLSITCDDEDDYIPSGDIIARYSTSITPDLPIEEPDNSLNMGDEHLDTIPATESDEVIKSSVENLVSSDFVESLINRDTSIVYSSKIDPILEEFTDELAHIAPIPPGIVAADPEIVEVCVDDDDTDDDDDYDDDFYDCVDIEEDGGEIDLDISKIVDISLREKLVESYLLIEKINTFNLSPPIPISPTNYPSSTIPVVDLDLPLEEADVPSFSDDSMIFPEYESFTFDDEPVMAEVKYEEEDTFTFTTRTFLPFVTYPEVLPVSYSTGSEDKIFNPGIFDNDAFKDKSSKELAPSKALLTLNVFDPLHPPLMDFNVTKAFSGIFRLELHGSIFGERYKAIPTISIDGLQSSLHNWENSNLLSLFFIELTSILLARP